MMPSLMPTTTALLQAKVRFLAKLTWRGHPRRQHRPPEIINSFRVDIYHHHICRNGLNHRNGAAGSAAKTAVGCAPSGSRLWQGHIGTQVLQPLGGIRCPRRVGSRGSSTAWPGCANGDTVVSEKTAARGDAAAVIHRNNAGQIRRTAHKMHGGLSRRAICAVRMPRVHATIGRIAMRKLRPRRDVSRKGVGCGASVGQRRRRCCNGHL